MLYHLVLAADQRTSFTKIDAKIYVPVVTLSTQYNAKLLQQLNSGFKRGINWNKYHSKLTVGNQNPYLDHLIDPISQAGKIIFVLSFNNYTYRILHTRYFLTTIEMKD